jgi:hypothetical protein
LLLFSFFFFLTPLKRELVYLGEAKTVRKGLLCGGALRGVPRRVGGALRCIEPVEMSLSKCSGIKTGKARFYGAREGAALPLKYYFILNTFLKTFLRMQK